MAEKKKRNSAFDSAITGIANALPGPLKPVQPPVKPTPPPQPTAQEKTNKTSDSIKLDQQQPTIFTDTRTGRQGGIELNDGRVFLGLGPEDVNKIAKSELSKVSPPEGTVMQKKVAEENAAVRQNLELVNQIPLSPTQLPPQQGELDKGIDFSQAIKAGALNVGTGASVGAIAGLSLGGGVGAVGGTAVGATTDFIRGFVGSIKQQASEDIAVSSLSSSDVEKNLKAIIRNVNAGGDPTENYNLFLNQLARADQSYSNLKAKTQRQLNQFTGKDGRTELVDYEIFNQPAGTRQILVRNMAQAMLNPDPNKALLEAQELMQNGS